MGSWDGLDRRRFPRVNYPCLVTLNSEKSGAEEIILTHTENVGIGGMCIVIKKNLRMFSAVEVELDLLDLGEHIKCSGKVVWNIQRRGDEKRKPSFYDVGIEFQNLPDKQQARLKSTVERLVKAVVN